MVCHSNRADPWAASAMRDAERFMKIEVAGIDSKFPGATDADQGVEVGAVHIDLAARLVDFFTQFSDGGFKDSMCRRVSDHGGGDSRSVFF